METDFLHAHGEHVAEDALTELRPTQMTVGYAEVLLKRQQWRALDKSGRRGFLAAHPLPAVLGPKLRHYVVDHHHLGRALLEEGVVGVRLVVWADLSALAKDEFWVVMDHRQWLHPYDARGRRKPFTDIPKALAALVDDPYRSLAAAVRMDGGFPKDQTPFAEFLWADFFRRRVSAELLRDAPDAALDVALRLVHDKAAMHLPGWSGPGPDL
jgi:hypothetical protein